jgi:hypothetical protein
MSSDQNPAVKLGEWIKAANHCLNTGSYTPLDFLIDELSKRNLTHDEYSYFAENYQHNGNFDPVVMGCLRSNAFALYPAIVRKSKKSWSANVVKDLINEKRAEKASALIKKHPMQVLCQWISSPIKGIGSLTFILRNVSQTKLTEEQKGIVIALVEGTARIIF